MKKLTTKEMNKVNGGIVIEHVDPKWYNSTRRSTETEAK